MQGHGHEGTSRRKFIGTMGAFAATAAIAQVRPSSAAAMKRPNFLFVIADEMRADALGVSGNAFCETPALNALAHNGVRFANGYVVQALCTPSRGAMMSGVYPHTSGLDWNVYFTDNALTDPKLHLKLTPTWPELLRQAGYYTGYFGKWHLGNGNPGIFDEFVGYNSGKPHWMGERYKSEYRSDFETQEAIQFLEKNQSKQFLLAVSYYPPHVPYDPPKEYAQIYVDKKTDEPLTDEPYYYGAVTAIDHDFGLILDKLKELGLEENTFVIFVADHGETFGRRLGSANKVVCYDDSAKIPYLFRWPAGLPSGVVYTGGVTNLDLMPTILEVAGVPVPARCQGKSHLRDIREKKLGWKGPVFLENISGGLDYEGGWQKGANAGLDQKPSDPKAFIERAVRTEDWKLILRDKPRDELYHIADDPGETKDLIGDPVQKARIAELAALIKQWGEKYGDPVAVKYGSKYM